MRLRAALTGLAVSLTALVVATPAGAAGTGGIEVTPLPAVVDGEQVTAFRVELPGSGEDEVPFLLRNVEDGERSATVYAARASRSPDGSYAVGDAGSSPYVSYERREVTLAEGEQREESFVLRRPEGDSPSGEQYAAIVIEVGNGSVVQRAATLVYIDPGTALPVSLPVLVVLVAVALALAAAAAWAVVARRRRRPAAS